MMMIGKLTKTLRLAGVAVALSAVAACATTPVEQTEARATSVGLSGTPAEADRAAIKAMAGTYKVRFHFEELVSFQEGYELKEPKDSGAFEVVRVIADEPGFISLQHILVVGGDEKFPVKHWRQDWIYEPAYIYEFVGFNAWKKRELSEKERAGKWAQVVYQVDDSPRYAAVAEWQHQYGISEWAGRNWRPLPRRDMTTREDYDGLAIQNRHAITFDGWVHEQDNTKLILRGDKPVALTREVGVNTYKSSDEFDAAIADDYWAATKEYWAGVRAKWHAIEEENETFGLTIQGEPSEIYNPLLSYADDIQADKKSLEEAISAAEKVLDRYVTSDIETSIADAKADLAALAEEEMAAADAE